MLNESQQLILDTKAKLDAQVIEVSGYADPRNSDFIEMSTQEQGSMITYLNGLRNTAWSLGKYISSWGA